MFSTRGKLTLPSPSAPGTELSNAAVDRVCVWHLLDVGVGADDVLDLIGVRVLEGEAARPDQHPLPVLHAEAVHHGQHLTLQLHHLHRGERPVSTVRLSTIQHPSTLPPDTFRQVHLGVKRLISSEVIKPALKRSGRAAQGRKLISQLVNKTKVYCLFKLGVS